MTDPNPDPGPPDTLSEDLIQQIDQLDVPALKSLHSYIEERIESLQPISREEIRADAAGEVIQIDQYEGYVLVRKHPPNPDGPGTDTDITELYRVSREQRPDGTDSLHWSYIGDVQQEDQARCESCNQTLEVTVAVCPHCGSDDIVNADTED